MVEQIKHKCTNHQNHEYRKREKKTNDHHKSKQAISVQVLIVISAMCRLIRPASANPLPAEDISRVAEYSFSEKLQNPCVLIDDRSLERGTFSAESEQRRRATRRAVVKDLRAKAILLKESAQTILRTNVLPDCSSLELPLVALVPSAEDIKNSDPIDVLRMFYTSMLNHTAHVYFITVQIERYPSDESCNTAGLSVSAKTLGIHMRELICLLRLCIVALRDQTSSDDESYISDITSQILNEMLMDQPLCSRRSVRDCQTMKSAMKLFDELTSYLQRTPFLKDEEPA